MFQVCLLFMFCFRFYCFVYCFDCFLGYDLICGFGLCGYEVLFVCLHVVLREFAMWLFCLILLGLS